jgi:hypothetical protein
MNALPIEIRSDITKRYGPIQPKTATGISFSDVARPGSVPGAVLRYVAHEKDQWLVSYVYGGIAIRTVTVSYLQSESSKDKKLRFTGALEGDGCTVANTFLKGVSVEAGWYR